MEQETVETIEQPKTYPVQDGQCYYEGDHISVVWVFAFGLIIGLILG